MAQIRSRIHLARAVDPQDPQGPLRAACGAVMGTGEGLSTDARAVNCGQCEWLTRPRVPAQRIMRVCAATPLTPGHRTQLARVWHAETEAGGVLFLGVGEVVLPIPRPHYPDAVGDDLPTLKARAKYLFLSFAYEVQEKDAALALALASAAGRLDAPATVADLLERAHDEAVLLAHQPETEAITGWVYLRQADVGLKPYDEQYNPAEEEGEVSCRWYVRHFIVYFLLTGNPDYAVGQGPALLKLSGQVVTATAWASRDWSRTNMMAFCDHMSKMLPPAATASRKWARREAEIVGFKKASAWDIVKGGVEDGADTLAKGAKDLADELEPPGGWGVGLLILGLGLGGFAIHQVTKK